MHNRLNFQRYLLVQISETKKGNARQLGGLGSSGLGPSINNELSFGIKTIKDAALSAFDKANEENVAKIIGPVLQPSPSNIPSSLGSIGSSGNSGNSNGNSG